jgi:two-component system chemotaxis response regulator CheB
MIDVIALDDSALMRRLLREIIDAQPDMRLVATAADAYAARDAIKHFNPHVLTLDIELPKMSGLDFLDKLMRLRPMPVLMISSLTARGSEATLRALELGAVDFVAKPLLGIESGVQALADEIVDKIRIVAAAHVRRLHLRAAPAAFQADVALPRRRQNLMSTEKVVVIGASTGGTEALATILEALPADGPAVLIAQHMPPVFTRTFAERLDRTCRMVVREAVDGERVLPGHAYIAPGDAHLLLARRGSNYVTALSDAPPVNRHRPSVDVLFRSAANVAGGNAIGVILTGMGSDGAIGLAEMRSAGAYTIAQDEATCVVFGMPKSAISAGGVTQIAPITSIATAMMNRIDEFGPRAIRF